MYTHTRRRSDTLTHELRTRAGRWLRELREKRGLSQRELARKVGAEFTFVSQIENGRCRIPPGRYLVWADALCVAPREFVQGLLPCYDPVTHSALFGHQRKPMRRTFATGTSSSEESKDPMPSVMTTRRSQNR
jgi:transcriptional regulator with XRE-family HTH domain